MADIQNRIETLLQDAVGAALGEEHRETDPIVRPSGNPKFGDYQANLAMGLAKKLGQKPRDLAQQIAAKLPGNALLESAEVAGPGFINLRLTREALDAHAAAMLASDRLGLEPAGEPETVVVDYSGPNVAKEMHVGHLRSTVLGDAIARVLELQGHAVVRQNHLGDWGTQFGMLIQYLLDTGWEAEGEPEIGNLNRLYQQAKQKLDADPDFAKRARERVVALQSGDDETTSVWQGLVEESKRHFNAVYRRLGVDLRDADIRPESFYNDRLPGVIGGLEQAGLLAESEGAAVVYPEGFQDREGEPMPMIVRKTDGGYLYATTDLAAARFRIGELGASRLIYVTDARQSQHFAMVFQTLRQAGWADAGVRLDHVPFGAVLGPDRRPFKTREGGTVRLVELVDEAESRAAGVIREKNPDLPEAEQERIASAVGIGALKYADLSSDRIKDYVFDWNRMLAMDGNTAPYLQNAYVRIRSIFRKGKIDAESLDAGAIRAEAPAERALVLKLLQWPGVIASVADSLEPHRLCNWLYELATGYHQFYERCPVLTAEEASVRQSRLALSHLVARALQEGLGLLGIEVVERM
ncbi:MAG: arginine--tRNA ligase [Phycisphaeraceae bacterium]